MAKYFWRKYECGQCGHVWDRLTEMRGGVKDPLDDCPNPNCGQPQTGAHEYVERAPGLSTGRQKAAGKALDYVGKMMEEDYHIPPSMLKDKVYEGETGVKTIPQKEQGADYIKGGGSINVNQFLQAAKSSGGLGPNGNLSGIDILQGAGGMGKIPHPVRDGIKITAKD